MEWKLFLILICTSALVQGQGEPNTEEEWIDQLLGSNYNPNIRPDDGETQVSVNMYVRDIQKLDMFHGTMDLQVTLRQRWTDSRLAFTDESSSIEYLTINQKEKVWIPDTFIRNELNAEEHAVLVPNMYIRIFPNGDVLYSTRLSLKVKCFGFDLSEYPFDSQTCELQLASYAWTMDNINYTWKESNPVQVNKNIGLTDYSLAKYITDNCAVVTATGNYSCISASFEFDRQEGIVPTFYLPIIMFTVLAGLAAFISIPNIGLRLVIIFVCLLCITFMSFALNLTAVPRTTYTKSIDVWFEVNMAFVFLLLAESIVLAWGCKSAKMEILCDINCVKDLVVSGPISMKLDLACRILYFILLILFYVIYFAC